eukprot:9295639-Prorocentrum_lima.AAC.1
MGGPAELATVRLSTCSANSSSAWALSFKNSATKASDPIGAVALRPSSVSLPVNGAPQIRRPELCFAVSMKRTAVSSNSSGSAGAHTCVLPTLSCRPIPANLSSRVSANLFMPRPFSVTVMSSMYALIMQVLAA